LGVRGEKKKRKKKGTFLQSLNHYFEIADKGRKRGKENTNTKNYTLEQTLTDTEKGNGKGGGGKKKKPTIAVKMRRCSMAESGEGMKKKGALFYSVDGKKKKKGGRKYSSGRGGGGEKKAYLKSVFSQPHAAGGKERE